MREIKFRAWDKDYKKMITNFLLPESKTFGMHRMAISFTGEVFTFTDWDMAEYDEDEMYNSAKYPSRFKIMQYTGLKDTNGKEVYEGDIVRMHFFFENYHPVTLGAFEDEEEIVCKLSITPLGVYFGNNNMTGYLCDYLEDPSEELEVIGNIYENPELIGERHED